MKKLSALLLIAACFFVLPEYVEGQSWGTGTQGLAGDALANMDRAFSSLDAEVTPVDAYFLGRAVAANILAVYKPYTRNAELTQYVNRICQTLAINSSQPVAYNGYHVIILDSAEFNAFASSGGHIFITKGLVELASSEDMLAAVIAHELAHIILKHGVDIINEVRLTDEMMAAADRAADIAARNSANAKQLLYFRESITKTMDTLMKNGYAQSQEFDADWEALVLLAYAGYDPSALVEMLRVLQRVQTSQKGGLYSTHPSPRARIANVEKLRYRTSDTRKYRIPRFKSMQF
jgi:predicted Zn-dependent protease